MRLTMRTNLAMRALMYCAANPGFTVRKSDIAEACNASENHLAQVVHVLGLEGFLKTRRGRAGGVALALPASEIRVGAVVRALEADVPFTECFSATGNTCPLAGVCSLRCVLEEALEAFYNRLDKVTLEQLVGGNKALADLLARPAARVTFPAA